MIRFRLVTAVIGYLIHGFVIMMFIPLIAAFLMKQYDSVIAFAVCIILSIVLGRLAISADRKAKFDDLNRVESMGVVSFGWLMLSILGTVPYMYFGLGFVDAFFESMSGFTTTGSTILSDFSIINSSMFFYRGFTQWIGGLGILVIFVALLPQLAIAGRQLFFAEVSAESKDKLSPRIKDTAGQLLAWYTFLTLFCTVGLCFSGLDLATAATNAFSTIAAAGFSSQDSSIAGFHNPAAEWVIIVFMYLAGANFILQVRAANSMLDYLKYRNIESKRVKSKNLVASSVKGLFTNTELMAYTAIIAVASVAIYFILAYHMPKDTSIIDIVRQSLFQCISIITSTGCASVDYEYWPMAAKSVLIILMFIGGCSGSAGGGMKVIRVVILVKYFWKMLLKNIYPEAVIRIKLDNRTIRENDVQPILTFFMCYMALFLIGGTMLCTIENSLVEGYSGAIACLGNTGPGFRAIGPMGNFGHWHALSKLVAIILMWAGRLEVMALVIFFRPEPWRSSRW